MKNAARLVIRACSRTECSFGRLFLLMLRMGVNIVSLWRLLTNRLHVIIKSLIDACRDKLRFMQLQIKFYVESG